MNAVSAPREMRSIRFKELDLHFLLEGGLPYIAVRPACESRGLDWSGQFSRIQRDTLLSEEKRLFAVVAADGRTRDMVFLPVVAFFIWLITLDASRKEGSVKAQIINIQHSPLATLIDEFAQYLISVLEDEKAELARRLSKFGKTTNRHPRHGESA